MERKLERERDGEKERERERKKERKKERVRERDRKGKRKRHKVEEANEQFSAFEVFNYVKIEIENETLIGYLQAENKNKIKKKIRNRNVPKHDNKFKDIKIK